MAGGKGDAISSFIGSGGQGNNPQGLLMNGYLNNKKAKASDLSYKGV
jgi:hypothetical protein